VSELKVAFLINLDRRPDRWLEFNQSSSSLDIPIERFSAVDGLDLPKSELRTPSPVAACWMSHQEVAREFLEGEAEYCLVLEDDLALTKDSISALNQFWKQNFQNFDLLQIGFCVSNNQLSNRVFYNRQRHIVNILRKFELLSSPLTQRLLQNVYGYKICNLEKLNLSAAVNTFELGTHAYLISRRFAEMMVSFNRPVYLPADLAMMEIVKTGEFQSFRLIRSLIDQSASPSSISNASANSLEMKISDMLMKVSP
jgi:GR25 family glycosyltransferase involved in LPS biosynthesis